MDLHGIGPSSAARLMIEVGDITRFPDRNHFASWNGTAPIDASSGAAADQGVESTDVVYGVAPLLSVAS